jgi:GNAT superfamily N-acetyltransferase
MHDELIAPGVIRKLLPWETDVLAAHLLRLDPESRHCRFAAGVSDETITAYALQALGSDAVVHGFLDDGTAEVAVTVEEAWRQTGVGSALFGRLLLTARNRGISDLVMTCLPSNRGMQRLAARFDGKITYASGDSFAEVKARPPTPISLWREVWTDSSSVAASFMDRQMQILRRARSMAVGKRAAPDKD